MNVTLMVTTNQGYINQVQRSEKKVGNNKLVAVFPDDTNLCQASGGRPVGIPVKRLLGEERASERVSPARAEG